MVTLVSHAPGEAWDLLLPTQQGYRPSQLSRPSLPHWGWQRDSGEPPHPPALAPRCLGDRHRCNPSAHSEHSVSALSAQNFLQSCLGRAPGPKFLVGDVHAVCDNGPGRTLRGRLPWLISSSDNREVSPLYLLESWPGLGGGLEGEAQPHCRPSRPGHLGRKGSASESGELPRAFHSCPQQEGFNPPLTRSPDIYRARPRGQALIKVLWDFNLFNPPHKSHRIGPDVFRLI